MQKVLRRIVMFCLVIVVLWFLYSWAQEPQTFILTVNVPGNASVNDTEAVLNILSELDVAATVFVPGAWMETNEVLVRRIAAEHELACYTYSEARLAQLEGESLAREIGGCAEAFSEFNVSGFRAPANDVGVNSYPLIAEHFLYDSSVYGRYEWFWEDPEGIVEVPVSSVLVMPLDDWFGVSVFRMGDFFFWLAKKARQEVVVMAVTVGPVNNYLLDLEYLVAHYQQETNVTTIKGWLG